MSIALHLLPVGDCIGGPCGPLHTHRVMCDWGLIEDPPLFTINTETGEVTVEGVQPLILVSGRYADDPDSVPSSRRAESSVTTFYGMGGRRFMRITAANGTWVWQLHEARWADGYPCNLYVGRWRD